LAPTETNDEPTPESVTLADIRSAFAEIERAQAAQPDQTKRQSDSNEELNPEDFHLRFNQANSIARRISEAADSLLKIADSLKVNEFFCCCLKVKKWFFQLKVIKSNKKLLC
jgi:hypothetical protein